MAIIKFKNSVLTFEICDEKSYPTISNGKTNFKLVKYRTNKILFECRDADKEVGDYIKKIIDGLSDNASGDLVKTLITNKHLLVYCWYSCIDKKTSYEIYFNADDCEDNDCDKVIQWIAAHKTK